MSNGPYDFNYADVPQTVLPTGAEDTSMSVDGNKMYMSRPTEVVPEVTSPNSIDDLLNQVNPFDSKLDNLFDDVKLDLHNEESHSLPNIPTGVWNSDIAISSDFFVGESDKIVEPSPQNAQQQNYDNDNAIQSKSSSVINGSAANSTANSFSQPMSHDQYSMYNNMATPSSAPLNGYVIHPKYSSIPILAPKNQNNYGTYNSREDNEDDEKRQQKLARNRESARQSRRRKKQYQELLDDKINDVVNELIQARQKHLQKSHDYLLQQIHRYTDALKSCPNPSENPTFTLYQNLIAPNNKESIERDQFIFTQLTELSLPYYTKFMFWLFNRNTNFFAHGQEYLGRMAGSPQDSSNASSAEPPSIIGPGSLWPQFIYFLNLSAEQEQRLRQHSLQPNMSYHSKLHNTDNNIKECTQAQNLTKELGEYTCSMRELNNSIFDSLNNILTPNQQLNVYKLYEENDFSYLDHEEIITSALSQLPNKEDYLKSNKDFFKQYANITKTTTPTFYDITNILNI